MRGAPTKHGGGWMLTWKDTGKTVLGMDATVLEASTEPGSYWRMAHVMAILVPR